MRVNIKHWAVISGLGTIPVKFPDLTTARSGSGDHTCSLASLRLDLGTIHVPWPHHG